MMNDGMQKHEIYMVGVGHFWEYYVEGQDFQHSKSPRKDLT